MREHREWQEQFQLRTRKQYPAEFWDKSRRGKVRPPTSMGLPGSVRSSQTCGSSGSHTLDYAGHFSGALLRRACCMLLSS